MKPHLANVTLICVDTTSKAHLAERAILKSLEQCSFGAVKLLTDNMSLKYAVRIPRVEGLEGYSKFCVQEMAKYVQTPYAIVCQSDGYILRGESWTDEFLNWDYIGSPFNPSGVIGNGGFSGRSKRLLDYMARQKWADCHPEDSAISGRHRAEIEASGMWIAPQHLARQWGVEGRSWDKADWAAIPNKWTNEFGFHSWLTPLPKEADRPNIYVHSGDMGDVVYGAAVMKALGGGFLFLTPDNRYPYPLNSRWSRTGGEPDWVDNLKPLLLAQDYIWGAQYTPKLPFSTDYDLNRFRLPWKNRSALDTESIFQLHQRAFGTTWPENAPWLSVAEPVTIPGRDVLVALTPRYRSDTFEWAYLVAKYRNRMAFIGTEQEAETFQGFCAGGPIVPWHRTKDALELARVIQGAKVLLCNQSLPLAIAHGLGKRVLVDVWQANPNCCLKRGDNAVYCHGKAQDIPEHWL